MRRAWGLNEGLQILDVGSNLFQFKFNSKFDMERVVRSRPWTFDNQLLMLKRWSMGMTSKKYSYGTCISMGANLGRSSRHGFTFSCWGGGKQARHSGISEKKKRKKKEPRWSEYVYASPYGVTHVKADSLGELSGRFRRNRTWCKFKYERLLLFCHHCGLLGRDLRHCAIHFAAIRKEGEVKC